MLTNPSEMAKDLAAMQPEKILNSSIPGKFEDSPLRHELLVIQKMHADVPAPFYAKDGDAGFDMAPYLKKGSVVKCANGSTRFEQHLQDDAVTLAPFDRAMLPTGIRWFIRPGFEIQMRLRSSAFKTTVRLCNQVGTLDSGYRGEVFIAVENLHPTEYVSIHDGDRIAQCILSPVMTPKFPVLENTDPLENYFPPTERGTGGFGSTGK